MALFPSVNSLNSSFDTGNDSWFSSGVWQVSTPVQKMPASTGALGRGGGGAGKPEGKVTSSCWVDALVWLSNG